MNCSEPSCSHRPFRLLLLMGAVLLGVCLQAQNPQAPITMDIRNATLRALVSRLENATGYTFVYGDDVKLTRRIDLNVQKLTIDQVLEEAFRDQPVEFKISGKHIVLRKREMPRKRERRRFTVSGYVTDAASAETLIGANILDSRYAVGTASNAYGFYTLTLPEGEVSLSSSYLGYTTRTDRFRLRADTTLNIALNTHNELQEVVVTSEKREAGINATNMGAHDIPMTQIRHTPSILGEADVLKTIQLMPGVQAGMEGFAGMYVRGGTPDQNLVMLDGIPVYNADHLLGIFSVFTPEAVKNVTLFKSSFPARYGGRLSSVVDVRTNDGDMHRYHGALSIGMLTDKFHIEGPLRKERTSFSLSMRVTPSILLPKGIKTTEEWGNGLETERYNYYFYDINAKVNHKFGDRDRLFLGFYRGKDHFRYDDEYERQPASDITTYSQYTSQLRLNWGNLIGYARWNHVFNSRLFGNFTASYNQYRMSLNETSEDRTDYREQLHDYHRYRSEFRSGIRDWSLRADFDFTPSTRHRIRFGSEFIHHLFTPGVSTSHIGNVDDGSTRQDTTYASSNLPQRGMELSLYGEDSWEATDRLSLNLGVRTSLFHTQGKNYLSAQPRVSARYDWGKGIATKASYSCMAQYVHLLTATPFSMPTDLWVPITRNIRPMYANQYSVGTYYIGLPGWEFSLEGYYKQMRHILEYQDGVSFFGTSTHWEEKVEMGQGRSYGLELMVQRTVGNTTGWLAYTLAKSERRFPNGSINHGRWFPHKYDRRHSLNLCVNHRFSDRIDVGASWIFYTGGCLTIPERRTVIVKPDGSTEETDYISGRNNYRLPVTHRLNIGVNFNKKTKHGMRTWNISLYNAYNAMNPNLVYTKRVDGPLEFTVDESGHITQIIREPSKTVIKKMTILPCIPSVTYTYRF